MKVLHIIRNNDDKLASQVINEVERLNNAEQALLMIQDGVYLRPGRIRAFACADDVRARGVKTDLELLEYEQIVDLLFEYDRVITW